MNPNDDNYDAMAELLRSRKPAPQPSPELEARILQALERPLVKADQRKFPLWFLLPPAIAGVAALVVFALSDGVNEPVEIRGPVVQEAAEPEIELPELAELLVENPLESEARALQRDVKRAGDFLVKCLPSIGSMTE